MSVIFPDPFTDPGRTDAEDAARALAGAATRLGLALDDITINGPCPTCRRSGHRITLGPLIAEQVHALAGCLNAVPAGAVPEDAGA